MSTIHFIGGEKGGVGKSVVARLLAQYFIDRKMPFLGFDSDRSHGALMRFYSDYASPVVIDRYQSLDTVIEAAAEESQRSILVDLAAQTEAPLSQWMEDSEVLSLADELHIRVCYWHVMDAGKDSVDLLAKAFERFDMRLDFVIAQNAMRGNDFSLYEQSGLAQKATELSADVIQIPALHTHAMQRIDAHSASFWAAAHNDNKDITGLGMLDRQRVRVWLKKVYAQFEQLDL